MKLILILMVLFTFLLSKEENSYSLESAVSKSIELQKPILYLIVSSKCPHCIKYINTVISPNIKDIKKGFILAISIIDNGDSVPNDIQFSGTVPSTYIISSSGKVLIGAIEGEISAQLLFNILNNVRKKEKRP